MCEHSEDSNNNGMNHINSLDVSVLSLDRLVETYKNLTTIPGKNTSYTLDSAMEEAIKAQIDLVTTLSTKIKNEL